MRTIIIMALLALCPISNMGCHANKGHVENNNPEHMNAQDDPLLFTAFKGMAPDDETPLLMHYISSTGKNARIFIFKYHHNGTATIITNDVFSKMEKTIFIEDRLEGIITNAIREPCAEAGGLGETIVGGSFGAVKIYDKETETGKEIKLPEKWPDEGGKRCHALYLFQEAILAEASSWRPPN